MESLRKMASLVRCRSKNADAEQGTGSVWGGGAGGGGGGGAGVERMGTGRKIPDLPHPLFSYN